MKLTRPILLVGSESDCPDIVYATGFRAPDPSVLFCAEDRRILVVSPLEQGRAVRAAAEWTRAHGTRCSLDVVTPEQLGLSPRRRGRLDAWAGAVLKRAGVRRVAVPAFFPHGIAEALRQKGIRVVVSNDALMSWRAVKSVEEVKKIQESQQAAVIAMRAAMALIASAEITRRGGLAIRGRALTSEMVRRLITHTLLEQDCSGKGTIVACGPQSVDPHALGTGPLMAHQPIVIDIFPQHEAHGYWGDLTRTVVRGTPTPALRRMYHAVRAAQGAALATIRAGVSCRRVHRAAADEFVRRGYDTRAIDGRAVGFIHSVGHGVGLAIHEWPRVSLNDTRLRKGHVITVEPGLYYPDIGGIRVEDTVMVTTDGWRGLVPCEKRFEI